MLLEQNGDGSFLIHTKYEQGAPGAVEHILWQVQLNLDLEVAQSN